MDAPPIAAVVRASYIIPDVQAPEHRVETPQKVFILQRREGALDAALAKSDPANAAKVAEAVEAIEGNRTEVVELLIRRMHEINQRSRDATNARD